MNARKFLALALALVLCLGLLPVPALADSAVFEPSPTKVITSGITRWSDLTARGTSNFVATGFATAKQVGEDGIVIESDACEYYLNGEGNKTLQQIQAAAIKRGTVVEFYTNVDGLISTVKAYEYTVDQVENGDAVGRAMSDGSVQVRVPGVINTWTDADRVTGWQGLVEGDVVLVYRTDLGQNTYSYTIEKAEKITGRVTSFNTRGVLTINGASYKGSEQPASGSFGDVTFQAYDPSGAHTSDAEGVFSRWTSNYNLVDEYDFYLDKDGSIVAGIQITESFDASKVCLVLQTKSYANDLGASGSLRAELLFVDGTTDIVDISKIGVNVSGEVVLKTVVNKETPANPERQIYTVAAEEELLGDGVLTQFFSYRATSNGYELTAMNASNDARNWENPKSLGNGSAKVATVLQDGFFAKELGTSTTGNDHNLTGWIITANSNTTFVVGKRSATDDTVAYSVYQGFRNVPTMDATIMTAICANTDTWNPAKVNTVAKFVYLETDQFKGGTVSGGGGSSGGGSSGGGGDWPSGSPDERDPQDGYIFIRDNIVAIDPELAEDDVYLVNIVDMNGKLTEMRVTSALARAISNDPTTLNRVRDYVGKFFAIGEIDENGVVSSLTDGTEAAAEAPVAVDTMIDIGDDVITLASASYDYDDSTKFIYVDMGWTDGMDINNKLGEREADKDDIDFKAAGEFSPNGFYNETDVDATTNANGATYITVDAVVVCAADSYTADYVYVLRTLWDLIWPVLDPSPSPSPSVKPSTFPSAAPSTQPSTTPSTPPSTTPSTTPSTKPSTVPSEKPSSTPSAAPSTTPSTPPSAAPVAVTGVTLNKTAVSLQKGGTTVLTATVKPTNAANKGVYWTSDDTYVVTADANGKLTARKAGTATVTATTLDGNFTATCTVTVTQASNSGGGGSSGSGSRPSGGGSSSSGGGGGGSATPPAQTATPASELFTDVVKGSWYEPGVTYVVNKGLFKGMSEKIFSPHTNMTRAMVMTVLARMDGQDTANATNGPWYTNIMNWAVAKGITDGTMPDHSVTREQLVTLLYRYAKATAVAGDLTSFVDGASVSPYAREAMVWAVKQGILFGKDGARLDPQGTATRAEVATIFQRFVENK